ncbi:MAG: Crp/Fnr family transcriptional regulator [Krumholzibacteria bacterium]|nr:Crp/Fnr family transcriptional regulator [Candidatus Krumholzibacteria bacterium]
MPHDGQDMLAGIRLPASLEPGLRQELEAAARTVQVPAGTVVFHPGDEMETFLVVGEGSLRVYKASSEGREITLYYVGGGECCTLNILCLLTGRPSPATAFVESDVTALAFPRDRFLDWFARFGSMRDLVLGQMADRVHCMMALVEEVAFQRLDRRLAAYLLAATDQGGGDDLALTHEFIAKDLGSVREVVSRLLKTFESGGLVTLGRGRIAIRDRGGLERAGI